MRAAVLITLASSAGATQSTCGEVKKIYKDHQCCGKPDTAVTLPAPACPYNFNKPFCNMSEPQAPRDLTNGAQGMMIPKSATLNKTQVEFLPLVNVHFHLGAEHKSEAYSDGADSEAFDAGRRLAANVRPGWMCSNAGLSESALAPYTFQYCKGQVEVGKSYEVHYVHSSAGYSQEELKDADIDGIDDGLGGAANGRGLLNPMVAVQGQVYHIVNEGAESYTTLMNGWTVTNHTNSVMYHGSTTGTSHNNEICSPYAITWHVDKNCHKVTPQAFDNLCKTMKETYQMEADLYPHGSRVILDPKWVVKSEFVMPLA